MRHYGTSGVFFSKTAGVSPFAARVAAAMFSGAMVHAAGHEMDRQRAEAHQLNEQFRMAEQRMMAPVNQSLMHARAPMFVPAGSDLPVGWDEGMVRLASIARGAGEDMAKQAAMMPTFEPDPFKGRAPLPMRAAASAAAPTAQQAAKPGLMRSALGAAASPMGRKVLGYGALLGGGYLALKGVNAGLGALSRPAPAQQNWGAPGTQLPMGVNQYGQPQPGSPLMG